MVTDQETDGERDVVKPADADALVVDRGPEGWVGGDDQVHDTVDVGVQGGEYLND